MGLFGFLGNLAGMIPGVGSLIGTGLKGIDALTGKKKDSGGGFWGSPGGAAAITGGAGLLGGLLTSGKSKKEYKYMSKLLGEKYGLEEKARTAERGYRDRLRGEWMDEAKPELDYYASEQYLPQTTSALQNLMGGFANRYLPGGVDMEQFTQGAPEAQAEAQPTKQAGPMRRPAARRMGGMMRDRLSRKYRMER